MRPSPSNNKRRRSAAISGAAASPRRTLRPRRRRPILDDFANFDDYFLDDDYEDYSIDQRRKLRSLSSQEPRQRVRVPARSNLRPKTSPESSNSSYFEGDGEDDGEDEGEDAEPVGDDAERGLAMKRILLDEDCGVSDRFGDFKIGNKNGVQKSKGALSGFSSNVTVAGTPLPEKKLLELVLDKIQKKDKYRLFAEPVDPEELPDYHDVIEHPMDFGTVRKKLAGNCYSSFEQFEDDVFLICSNAMQYNAPHTIPFRKARAMQDLGMKEFQRLRDEGKYMGTDPKSDKKIGITPIKNKPLLVNTQKPLRSVISVATVASQGDASAGMETAHAIGTDLPVTINRFLCGNSSLGESKSEKVDEPSGKGIKAFQSYSLKDSPGKLGKKSVVAEENQRITYHKSDQQPIVELGLDCNLLGDEQRQLFAVYPDAEYSYARSLARFAASLGPIGWNIASRRIASALPAGVTFGPGWVDEYEPPCSSVVYREKRIEQQLDADSAMQSNCVLKKNKDSKLGSKTEDTAGRRAPSQIVSKMSNRDSSLVDEKGQGRTAEHKQQYAKVTPETKSRNSAAGIELQNETTSMDFRVKNGIFLEHAQVHQRSSSSSSSTSGTAHRTDLGLRNATSRSLGVNSSGSKILKPELVTQIVPQTLTDTHVDYDRNCKSSNPKLQNISGYDAQSNPMGLVSNQQPGFVQFHNLNSTCQDTNNPSRLMGMGSNAMTRNMLNLSDIPNKATDSRKLFPPAAEPSDREGSNNAFAAAALAQMTNGTSSHAKLSVDITGVCEAPVRQSYGSWRTANSSPRTLGSQITATMPQAVRQTNQVVSTDPHVPRGLASFPHLVAIDLSRYEGYAACQGTMQMQQIQQKNNKNTCPPDLNVTLEFPISPVKQSSSIPKDPQQPDLALQL